MKGEIKIKKVITAIGVNSLNIELREKTSVEVIGNDIPYQDGVLDVLKGNSEIDVLILNENLIGEFEIKDFLNRIKEINSNLEIIFFMEKENIRLNSYLEKVGVSNVFIDGEVSIDDILKVILEEKNNDDFKFEIENLKEIINGKNSKKIYQNARVIAISGNYGSGKSLITSLLGKAARKDNIKTIIIDFDIINSSINTIFRIKKYNLYENQNNIESFITHISSNLDVFCGIDALFTEKNKINYEKVEGLISELKNLYDFIIIDTSSETNLKFTKVVLANVDKVVFLVEPNLLEIKKAERLLEIYVEDWEVYPKKIQILFNKVNNRSIDKSILNELFGKFKIIGDIRASNKFTEIANDIRECDLGLNKYVKILGKIDSVKKSMKK